MQCNVEQLQSKVSMWHYCYYVLGQSQVGDDVYDGAVAQLQRLRGDAMTTVVSTSPSTVTTTVKMANPATVRTQQFMQQLQDWGNSPERSIVSRLHLVGVDVNLRYVDGHLVSANLYGDGLTGVDVTATVRSIPSVLPALDWSLIDRPMTMFEVRGTVVMLKQRHVEAVSNARAQRDRGVCGSVYSEDVFDAVQLLLRGSEPAKVARSGLAFIVHSYGQVEPHLPASTIAGFYALCENLGFFCADHLLTPAPQAAELHRQWQAIHSVQEYESDGVCCRANTLLVDGPAPEICLPWVPANKHTRVREVHEYALQNGDSRQVALIDPVAVDGLSIQAVPVPESVSLAPGDAISVRLEGMIPALKRLPEDTLALQVECCLHCYKPMITYGQTAECSGWTECVDNNLDRISHFCSAVSLRCFDTATLEKLVRAGQIHTAADIYRLDDETLSLLGYSHSKANRILDAIEASKGISLSDYLNALGTGHSLKSLESVAEYVKTLSNFIPTTALDLEAHTSLSMQQAINLKAWWSVPNHKAYSNDLLSQGVYTEE